MSRMRSEVPDLLDQLGAKKPQLVLAVGGYELPVTNLEKTSGPARAAPGRSLNETTCSTSSGSPHGCCHTSRDGRSS
jgi:hypothetical protein